MALDKFLACERTQPVRHEFDGSSPKVSAMTARPAESGAAGPVPRRRGARPTAPEPRFYQLEAKVMRQWPGVEWVNQVGRGRPPDAPGPWPSGYVGKGRGWDCWPMKDEPTPVFRTKQRHPERLADACYFAGGSWLLASAGLAALLEGLQPGDVAALPVEVRLGDGTALPVGAFCMVDVTRLVPAYDAGAMGRRIVQYPVGPRYEPELPRRLLLRPDIPEGLNLFRDEVSPASVYASRAVRDACRAAKYTRSLDFLPVETSQRR